MPSIIDEEVKRIEAINSQAEYDKAIAVGKPVVIPPASGRQSQVERIAALAGVDPDTGGPVPPIPSRMDQKDRDKLGDFSKRVFKTGATRDTESGKLDYEGFLSPLVMKRYAEYLNGHRTMKDGSTRDSDNWQKGIPFNVYMKSAYRHFIDMWIYHRGWLRDNGFEDAMCAVLFNVMGYLHERLKAKLLTDRADEVTFNEMWDGEEADLDFQIDEELGI